MKRAPLLCLYLLATTPALAVDCETGFVARNPDSVYTDHGDGTVTDTRSGLMWKRCVEGQQWTGTTCSGETPSIGSWALALQTAADSSFAGYSDWRLPTVKELFGLVETCRKRPSINTVVFPLMTTPASDPMQAPLALTRFWSASPEAELDTRSWVVLFDYGEIARSTRTASSDRRYLRLVRGGR